MALHYQKLGSVKYFGGYNHLRLAGCDRNGIGWLVETGKPRGFVC